MAMVVLTSEQPNTKTSKAISFPHLNCGDEESFELKISADPNRTINPFVSSTRKQAEDGEIDVFSAEKYFSEEAEEYPRNAAITTTPKYHQKKDNERDDDDDDDDPAKPKSRPRTPSIRSESSWNSRSLLLQKVPRTHNHQQPPKNSTRFHRKKFLASIGCNYCSCKDKNSLDVVEKNGKRAEKPPSRDNDFPVFYPKNGNKKLQEEEEEEGKKKSFNFERRLTVVAWDAITPTLENKNPISSKGIDYDTGSEASSDLFEIESFPGNSNPFLATTTTSYAPSEASIEWSVVTASAADFSVASDSEAEPKMLSSALQNGRELVTKEKQTKRLPSILLGCKSQKAVVVAGDAYRTTTTTSEKVGPGGTRRHHSSEAFLPLTRFHKESFGSVRNSGSFSASISNRESHVLYI